MNEPRNPTPAELVDALATAARARAAARGAP
jgi:hypothetical protein